MFSYVVLLGALHRVAEAITQSVSPWSPRRMMKGGNLAVRSSRSEADRIFRTTLRCGSDRVKGHKGRTIARCFPLKLAFSGDFADLDGVCLHVYGAQ